MNVGVVGDHQLPAALSSVAKGAKCWSAGGSGIQTRGEGESLTLTTQMRVWVASEGLESGERGGFPGPRQTILAAAGSSVRDFFAMIEQRTKKTNWPGGKAPPLRE